METKICRICGKIDENYIHIFKTEGLKNKIETCLPIIVVPYCLLPDTICTTCLDSVNNFYSFIKNCLQNIIVLEAQYNILESCLKTKRKTDKGIQVADIGKEYSDKNVETDSCVIKSDSAEANDKKENATLKSNEPFTLVSYDVGTDSEAEEDDATVDASKCTVVIRPPQPVRNVQTNFRCTSSYFADADGDIIKEITQRKRKSETSLLRNGSTATTTNNATSNKRIKLDGEYTSNNRRKSRQPKKLEVILNSIIEDSITEEERLMAQQQVEQEILDSVAENLPQVCLLCDQPFSGPAALAAHVYEMHGIDMAQVRASQPVPEQVQKKRIPDLVKIEEYQQPDSPQSPYSLVPSVAASSSSSSHHIVNSNHNNHQHHQPLPPKLQPSFACPLCPALFNSRCELFNHLRLAHAKEAAYMCGRCLHQTTSSATLAVHLKNACHGNPAQGRHTCRVCQYSDDSSKVVETHLQVHNFLDSRVDPGDYVQNDGTTVGPTCSECSAPPFTSFKEFSAHRRSQHSLFHCDLCPKFYGRNSHLWKHVNRVHKGDTAITCSLCGKTSASKYHLQQHFNKIHKVKEPEFDNVVRYQDRDLTAAEDKSIAIAAAAAIETAPATPPPPQLSSWQQCDEDEDEEDDDDDDKEDFNGKDGGAPKEIDTKSNLYTNIITNYTPPTNEGPFKCPKCLKGFHKKPLLKKHKKNCRPRLQKDLLTRCKTCARVFKDRQSLSKHLVNYHSEYTCELCGTVVQSKCEIIAHIRFSHPGSKLVCYCGQVLRCQTDLQAHQRNHSELHVCQFCGDLLPTKIKLKMHILSLHRKILSLSCGVCLKLFETQHVLRDHVRLVHARQLAPLTTCTVCGKNYGSKWKTFDHLNKSHGRIFKACKACLEVFDSEQELKEHYEAQHMKSGGGGGANNKNEEKHRSGSGDSAKDINSKHYQQQQQQLLHNQSDYHHNVKNETQRRRSRSPPSVPAFPQNMTPPQTESSSDMDRQQMKISLLEKRLMGSKRTEDEAAAAAAVPVHLLQQALLMQQKANLDMLPDQNGKHHHHHHHQHQLLQQQKDDEDSDPPSSLLLQNSSKRTVYENSNAPSFCEICYKTWPAKKHLWQHYIRCHKQVAATVCGICLCTNASYEALQVHLRTTHPTLLHGQGFGSNFICKICGRYHNARSKLRLHMAIHENYGGSTASGGNGGGGGAGQGATALQKTNGYAAAAGGVSGDDADDDDANMKNEDDINYESLIEEVEMSEEDDDDGEGAEGPEEEEDDDDEDDDDDDEGEDDDDDEDNEENDTSSNDSDLSDNGLEQEMLENMIDENQQPPSAASSGSTLKDGEELTIKNEIESEDDEDDEDDDEEGDEDDDDDNEDVDEEARADGGNAIKTESYQVEEDEDDDDDNIVKIEYEESSGSSTYVKTESSVDELDCAIRSIAYDERCQSNASPRDYGPGGGGSAGPAGGPASSATTLTQREIQSAVDSIL